MSDQSSIPILEAALQYAARGWRVLPLYGITNGACTCKAGAECPTPGKHPAIKTGKAFAASSSNPKLIEGWFKRGDRNLGVATGNGLLVVDVDGQAGLKTLSTVATSLPQTLMAQSGRPDGGVHLWFATDGPAPTNSGDGLDCRGDGGLVVVPPSQHASGRPYTWLNALPLAPIPAELLAFLMRRKGSRIRREDLSILDDKGVFNWLPDYLRNSRKGRIDELATKGMYDPATAEDMFALAEAVPNPDYGWEDWNKRGMAFYDAAREAKDFDTGLEAFKKWSSKSKKYDEDTCTSRWAHYHNHPPDKINVGALINEARDANPGFILPSRIIPGNKAAGGQTPDAESSPPAHHTDPPTTIQKLNKFNEKYWVVKIKGKARVMSWEPSSKDRDILEPGLMEFKSFREFYGDEYVTVGQAKPKQHPIGDYWLKWKGKKKYNAIDLIPKGPCPPDTFNLWRDFGVPDEPHPWPLFAQHIKEVIADGDKEAAIYIIRWCAWAVQNPDLPAEVALVLQGGKGAGKGKAFAVPIMDLFGTHGMHITSRNSLTGHFNAPLRDCLLLFADESFWAGDRQGESSLKALLTEKTLMIEHKGLDPIPWRNRLHVIMAANAEWVVPASHDERRYAVFKVSDKHAQEEAYFKPLYNELYKNGGLSGLLHDLKRLDLGDWHPRRVIKTAALQQQKEESLSAYASWWLKEVLEPMALPKADAKDGLYSLDPLLLRVKQYATYERLSLRGLGQFLRKMGAILVRTSGANYWQLPEINAARVIWEKRYGKWPWPE
jgi:Bifunctional DNA primase/polymerase, N-terminal/Family of unknown function (DUF5906)/Primase C terminal 2 (PriCT-2)